MLENFFKQPTQQSNHNFAQVPKAEIPRSSFDRSHSVKTAFDSGDLVPIYVDEVLPGDTYNLKLSAVARLSTPIVPFMDSLKCNFFFFFVPYRLLWSNFKKFMGEQKDPSDSISYVLPTMVSPVGGYSIGSLHDYMGLPTFGQVGPAATVTHMSLPLRAYNAVYQDWFKDENLISTTVQIDTGDGPDTYSNYVLRKRGKRKDYFTGCLPWPQKGTAVTLPLGTSAPVYGRAIDNSGNFRGHRWQSQVGGVTHNGAMTIGAGPFAQFGGTMVAGDNYVALGTAAQYTATSEQPPYADLTNATASTINEIRQAFQVQKLYERFARGGSRYTEIVRAHFGVVSPDARLQRPELLAVGSKDISLHPVPQTSATSGSNAQGGLSAFGTLNAQGIGFTKSFTEHGVLLGLASVNSGEQTYQQGLHKMWSRSARTDIYWPALSHLGEQAVLNKEIYCVGTTAGTDDSVFGYQERYAEYRYKPSIVTGKMRSTASGTIDIWHLAQKFTSLPTLGDTFINEAPAVSRVVAVNTEPQIIMDAYFNLKCARPMPVYSVPGMVDHF